MQFLLFFEAEDFAGFFVEDARNAVEGGVMEIGIEGGDRLDRLIQHLAQSQARHESAERIRTSIHGHDDLAAVHGLGVLDNQHVGAAYPAHHPLGIAADHAVLDRANAQCAHNHKLVAVGVDILGQHLPVPALQGAAFQRQVRLGALLHIVQVGIGDDLKASGDE